MTERLVVRVPGGQHHDFPLDAPVVSIGRAPDCDLVLDYPYISRVHARIERQGKDYLLVDSGSTNGTFVNGRRVEQMQMLASGDEIAMGDISIGFMQTLAGQATTTFFRPAAADSPIRCDSSSWQVWIDGRLLETRLSLQEFELLSLLSSRYGRVCTREELGTAIWGRGNYDLNMLHRLVHRLKQKLGEHSASIVSIAGKGYKLAAADEIEAPATHQFRTVLFTDLVGHTEMMQRLGDAKGRDVLRHHERITRETLTEHGGAELKTEGDSFMVSFPSVTSAITCAVSLQRAFAEHNQTSAERIAVRMGLNAGEPIEEDGDLFGSSVILAARIAAEAGEGEILIPEAVRHLLSGKSFSYADRGEMRFKGFEDAVRLYEVHWRE
jgi:class 3 adenylate cyclase